MVLVSVQKCVLLLLLGFLGLFVFIMIILEEGVDGRGKTSVRIVVI